MSRALDLLLTAQQRSDCAKNDAAMGGVMQPIPFHADVLTPFSEQELQAADVQRSQHKAQMAHALNDAHALDLQVQLQGYIGGLPS